MKDLSGHMIKPFEIHAGKAVPNIKIHYPLRMMENEFYAIEPFITTGNGVSILKEPKSHYMLKKGIIDVKLKKDDEYILSNRGSGHSSEENCRCVSILRFPFASRLAQSVSLDWVEST